MGWDLQAYHSLIRTYICTWGSVGLVCKPPVIVHFNPEAGVQDLQESEAQSSPNLEIINRCAMYREGKYAETRWKVPLWAGARVAAGVR